MKYNEEHIYVGIAIVVLFTSIIIARSCELEKAEIRLRESEIESKHSVLRNCYFRDNRSNNYCDKLGKDLGIIND